MNTDKQATPATNAAMRTNLKLVREAIVALGHYASVDISRGPAWEGWERAMQLRDEAIAELDAAQPTQELIASRNHFFPLCAGDEETQNARRCANCGQRWDETAINSDCIPTPTNAATRPSDLRPQVMKRIAYTLTRLDDLSEPDTLTLLAQAAYFLKMYANELDRSEPEQRETLDAAQPAQAGEAIKPVAWMWTQLMHDSMGGWAQKTERNKPYAKAEDVKDLTPLYLHPQLEQPASDKDVALALDWLRGVKGAIPWNFFSTIEEALAAYDPAKVGAMSVVRDEQPASAAWGQYEGAGLPRGMTVCGLDDGTIDVYTNDAAGKTLLNIDPAKGTASYAEKLAQSPAVSPPSGVAVAPKVAVSEDDVKWFLGLLRRGPEIGCLCDTENWKEALESFASRIARGGERDAEIARLTSLLNSPELRDFSRGVELEAAHQRERWGNSHDAGKEPADWFWLVGYLGGKALNAHIAGNTDKALHHAISTAAALANWHGAILGTHNMRPGIDGEAAIAQQNKRDVCGHCGSLDGGHTLACTAIREEADKRGGA